MVTDDGSTDDLDAALAPYDGRIRLIRKQNGGGASALNAGARSASGEFVVICDSDDVYLPGRIAALTDLAGAEPDADLLTTDAFLERDGQIAGRFEQDTPFAHDHQREAILERCFLFAPAIRRERLLAAGGADESLRIAYDWDLWMRLIHDGARASLAPEPLMRYRLRPGSLADRRVAALKERVTVLELAAARGGLSPAEDEILRRSLDHNSARWAAAAASAALSSRAPGARAALRQAARAPGVGPRDRLTRAAYAVAPEAAWPRPDTNTHRGGRDVARPTVGLLPWGNVIEDFLEPTGVTLTRFADEFTGSWLFTWCQALDRAGLCPLLICISRDEKSVKHLVHRPTGTRMIVLPTTRAYRHFATHMADPYARDPRAVFGRDDAPLKLLSLSRELSPYLATPPLRLLKTLRAESVRAVICQEYEFPRFDVTVALGALARVPVHATFQGGDYRRWRLEAFLRPHTVRRAAGLLVGPAAEAERVRSTYGVTPQRVPNPVDLDTWRPRDRAAARAELGIAPTAPVIAWHGRMSIDQKGLDVLLEAFRRVAHEHPDARLLLVGGGRDEARVAGEGIIRTGLLDDRDAIATHLSAADVYAFPSRHEGFPAAPIEAMACGLPVVASNVSGIPEIQPAVIVEPGDAEQLATALNALLDDEPRRRELAAAARRRAEAAFSLDAVGAQLREALEL